MTTPNGRAPDAGAGTAEDPPLIHPLTGDVLDPDNLSEEARLALVEVALRDTQGAVDELLQKLAADAKGGRPSRWSWHHATPQRRGEMYEDLRAFVDWLIGRYQPSNDAVIRPCWYQHPVAVEELWALMVAWRAAYCAGNRASDQLIAWHQHWLWSCLERLAHYANWKNCGNAHKPPTGVRHRGTDDDFDAYTHSRPALEPGPGDPAGALVVRLTDSTESPHAGMQDPLPS